MTDRNLMTIALLLAKGSNAQQPGEAEDVWAKRLSAKIDHLTNVATTVPPAEGATPLTLTGLATALAILTAPTVAGETQEARTTRLTGAVQHLGRVVDETMAESKPTPGRPVKESPREYYTELLGVTPVVRQSRAGNGVTIKKAEVHLKPNKEGKARDTAFTDITCTTLADGRKIIDPVAGALAGRCQSLVGHRVKVFAAYEMGRNAQGNDTRNKVLVDVVDLGLPHTSQAPAPTEYRA